MFKLLFMGLLIYYAYRMLMPPTRLEDHRQNDRFDRKGESSNSSTSYEDEYIDYEEVE